MSEQTEVDKAKKRIRKLLRLGDDDSGASEAERANALDKAARWAAKFDIDMAKMSAEQFEEVADGIVKHAFTLEYTRDCFIAIGVAAADVFGCRFLFQFFDDERTNTRAWVLGPAEFGEATVDLFNYLCEGVTVEAERSYIMLETFGSPKPDEKEYVDSFYWGCAMAINHRVRDMTRHEEQRERYAALDGTVTEPDEQALMVARKGLIKEKMNDAFEASGAIDKRIDQDRREIKSAVGFNNGAEFGSTVSLGTSDEIEYNYEQDTGARTGSPP